MIALCAALLACSLSFGDDAPTATPDLDNASRPIPVVTVLDPVPGATVPVGEPVSITVASEPTANRFQLNVSGHVASTKALPPGQQGPTQAILNWTPERAGTYDLEIVAFNGGAVSMPVSLQLIASGTGASASAGGGTCTGRVLVSQLNFRSGPGTSASRLGQFDVGETVAVIGRNVSTSWYQVERAGGQTGWVVNNGQWLQVSGACSGLPVTD